MRSNTLNGKANIIGKNVQKYRLVKDFELKAICKALSVSYEDIYNDTDCDD